MGGTIFTIVGLFIGAGIAFVGGYYLLKGKTTRTPEKYMAHLQWWVWQSKLV